MKNKYMKILFCLINGFIFLNAAQALTYSCTRKLNDGATAPQVNSSHLYVDYNKVGGNLILENIRVEYQALPPSVMAKDDFYTEVYYKQIVSAGSTNYVIYEVDGIGHINASSPNQTVNVNWTFSFFTPYVGAIDGQIKDYSGGGILTTKYYCNTSGNYEKLTEGEFNSVAAGSKRNNKYKIHWLQ
ncbi:MAG TPA: hypothetical protein VKR58_03880 [Aquella sp.]|nr:hypothetical protein [Aquella sp.]